MNQISSIEGGIADKTEDHIERIHQVNKRLKGDMYWFHTIVDFSNKVYTVR